MDFDTWVLLGALIFVRIKDESVSFLRDNSLEISCWIWLITCGVTSVYLGLPMFLHRHLHAENRQLNTEVNIM